MKGSLIIVSFFIIGTLCGVYHLIPYDFTDSKLSYYALCGLMFCVGISIGNDPNTLKSFRSLNPRLVFLPIMTIIGTLAGCAVAGAFMSEIFRKTSPYFCWWSHYNGYHSSYYYPIFGKRICNHFHFPWFCC